MSKNETGEVTETQTCTGTSGGSRAAAEWRCPDHVHALARLAECRMSKGGLTQPRGPCARAEGVWRQNPTGETGEDGGRLEGCSPGAGAQHRWSPKEGKRLRGVQPCGCPDRAHLSPGTPGEHGPVVPVPGPLSTAAQLQEAAPRPCGRAQAAVTAVKTPCRASTPRRDGPG